MQKLIFILGAFKRSGTNYLRDLLSYHPLCEKSPVPEDFLLANSDLLVKYIEQTGVQWGMAGKPQRHKIRSFLRDSLHNILTAGTTAPYIVCKTPSVEGIENIDELFPDSKVLTIVRDGRDTLESGRRSFGWLLPERAAQWRSNVERLVRFEKKQPGRSMRVHYEDLVAGMHSTMNSVLFHCGLPAHQYDWELAIQAPVRGSSDLKHRGGKAAMMHWHGEPRTDDFAPIGRYAETWTRQDHHDFQTIAGSAQTLLGYQGDTLLRRESHS